MESTARVRTPDSATIYAGGYSEFEMFENHTFRDLRRAGIVDPMGTAAIAFQIAAETAATLLTIDSAVLKEK